MTTLKQQLEELGLAPERPPSPEQWTTFLARVSETYAHAAQPRDNPAAPPAPAPAPAPHAPLVVPNLGEAESDEQTGARKRPDEVTALLRNLREKSTAVLQKNAAALAESLALAHAVQESVADAIMVVGTGGQLLAMNKRFREMVDLPEALASSPKADAILEHLKTLVKDPEQLRVMVRTSVDKPNTIYTNEIELKDGRVYDRYVAPVPNRDGTLYGRVICYRDVTERHRVDVQRAAAADRIAVVKELVEKLTSVVAKTVEDVKSNEELQTLLHELQSATGSSNVQSADR